MLGTRTAGELAGSALILELTWELTRAALRAGREAAGARLRAAVEDGLATLDSRATGIGRGRRRDRWRRWSFVDGSWPGLGHDDTANLRRGRCRRGRGCYGFDDRRRSSGARSGSWRRSVGCGSDRSVADWGGRGNRWSFKRSGFGQSRCGGWSRRGDTYGVRGNGRRSLNFWFWRDGLGRRRCNCHLRRRGHGRGRRNSNGSGGRLDHYGHRGRSHRDCGTCGR
jgi:hypothetical protein